MSRLSRFKAACRGRITPSALKVDDRLAQPGDLGRAVVALRTLCVLDPNLVEFDDSSVRHLEGDERLWSTF